jgi:hypothetical protein
MWFLQIRPWDEHTRGKDRSVGEWSLPTLPQDFAGPSLRLGILSGHSEPPRLRECLGVGGRFVMQADLELAYGRAFPEKDVIGILRSLDIPGP